MRMRRYPRQLRTILPNPSHAWCLALAFCAGIGFLPLPAAAAQQVLGHVISSGPGAQAASFSGVSIRDGKTELTSGSGATAGSSPLDIALSRGGRISLCSTSNLHISASGSGTNAPLMLALDKGAVEVTMPAVANDAILTPDLRFQIAAPSPSLDLRLRISRNGDTCVENRGNGAPVLSVAEQLGDATYQIQPGQHVLFEHGSLKEVVDNESSPCGCPPPPAVSVADSGISSAHPATPGSQIATTPSAATTSPEKGSVPPFPIAVSEGLAPPQKPAPTKPGDVEMQVTMPLTYSGDTAASSANSAQPSPATPTLAATQPAPASAPVSVAAQKTPTPAPEAPSPATAPATAQAPPATDTPPDLAHIIGHFFKRVFRHF